MENEEMAPFTVTEKFGHYRKISTMKEAREILIEMRDKWIKSKNELEKLRESISKEHIARMKKAIKILEGGK